LRSLAKQSENITSLAELTITATFVFILVFLILIGPVYSGSPRREPFRIVLQNFLYRSGIPQRLLLFFYIIRYLAYYTRRTLPGPDPVLLSSANSYVDRWTLDDSIMSCGKNLRFLIFNWFYGTLLIVLEGQTRKGIKGM